MVVALRGEIGAGKTCLVKGIARGLGVWETVTSPTYTIVSEYTAGAGGNIPVYHLDAYRLHNDEDFENTGAAELFGGTGITLIEWSERIPRSVPADALTITLKITGACSRAISIEGLEKLNEW